jgi:predicted dehydrogenase
MQKVRIAVIGAGSMPGARARGWISTVAKLTDHFDLCAICDANPQIAQEVSASHGVKAHYTDVETLFAQERPDLVLILVPTDGQAAVAVEAAKRKIHLITEIPYGITLEVGDSIAAICRENGVKWEIAEQVWLWPQEQLKHKVITSGMIGQVTHARLWYPSGSYHGFNAVRMLLQDDVKRVLGYVSEVKTEPYVAYGGENMETAVWEAAWLEFASGVVCLYERAPRPFPKRTKPSLWELEATHGYISGNEVVQYTASGSQRFQIQQAVENMGGERVLDYMYLNGAPQMRWENPYKQYRVGNLDDVAKASILTSMHRAITANSDPQYGAANARKDLEIWFAIFASADKSNTWVDLPLRHRTALAEKIHAGYLKKYGHDPVQGSKALLHARFGRLGIWWPVAQWL